MAAQEYRIVTDDESAIHGEPHIPGSRIMVRFVHELVEKEHTKPVRVAEKYTVPIADVYEALAYYHTNPDKMRDVEQRHRDAGREATRRTLVTRPETST